MDRIAPASCTRSEADFGTDLVASLLIEQASSHLPAVRRSESLPPKIYPVMLFTSLTTFGALATGYQLLFAHQIFA